MLARRMCVGVGVTNVVVVAFEKEASCKEEVDGEAVEE